MKKRYQDYGDYQEEPTIIEALAALYDASKEPR